MAAVTAMSWKKSIMVFFMMMSSSLFVVDGLFFDSESASQTRQQHQQRPFFFFPTARTRTTTKNDDNRKQYHTNALDPTVLPKGVFVVSMASATIADVLARWSHRHQQLEQHEAVMEVLMPMVGILFASMGASVGISVDWILFRMWRMTIVESQVVHPIPVLLFLSGVVVLHTYAATMAAKGLDAFGLVVPLQPQQRKNQERSSFSEMALWIGVAISPLLFLGGKVSASILSRMASLVVDFIRALFA